MRDPENNVAIFRITNPIILATLLLAAQAPSFAQESLPIEYHGAGWVNFGRVEESYTTPQNRSNSYQKNWLQNSGGQLTATTKFNESWDGGLGLGAVQVHLPRGNKGNAPLWYPFWVPFVAEARVTYAASIASEKDFQLTFGSFPYSYNPDAKNLGLYLPRGYVYPGTLVSGFGNIVGAKSSYKIKGLSADVILKSETDDNPRFDLSLMEVVGYQFFPGLEIGAGVNHYRLISQNKRLTSPGIDCNSSTELGPYSNGCFLIDSVGVDPVSGATILDTTLGSLGGTKVMARFSFDPKSVLGTEGIFGPSDLKIYGEAAIIGTKNYKKIYDDIKRRIPVMVGFNIPTFKYLDYLALEVEYYASKNSSDNLSAQSGSWMPSTADPMVKTGRDDWKWALSTAKVFLGNMKFSAQVANDHLRLGGTHNIASGVEVTTTPSDWHWTCGLAFFF